MRRHVVPSLLLAAFLLSSVAFASGPMVIGSSAEVAFPNKALNGGVLTVSLPDHSDFRMEFGPGQKPFFSLFDGKGNVRPDGVYTWQIVAHARQAKGPRGGHTESQVSTGSFSIKDGALVDSTIREGAATKDQVFNDDIIVSGGSLCVGFDCSNGESFGFDTIRMKENNLRLHFDDTSNSASFPQNDWRLSANDTSNGGENYLAIEDSTAGTIPFRVEAGAGANALYVDNGGEIGVGTATPVVELHVVDGDSPTLRLEQNGSSGFTPQTWDLAGNETNFFVRDATNGSSLPFRIRPSAPQNSIYIDTDGDVGMGTQGPSASLHIADSAAASLLVDGTGTANGNLTVQGLGGGSSITVDENSGTTDNTRTLLLLENNGSVRFRMTNSSTGVQWVINGPQGNGNLSWNATGNAGDEFTFTNTGSLEILGSFIAGGTTLTVPDYVFEEDYSLMPLSELQSFIEENKHLPNVPSAKTINAGKLDMTQMQMTLLEKVEELTLYTLGQEETIAAQQELIQALEARLEALEAEK